MRPPRTIGSNSTVSTLSLNRYGTKHGSDPRLELTPNELESLLNESFEFSATPTETAEPPKFPTALQNSKFHLHKKEMSGGLVQRFKKSHKRTSIKLIDALCSILESELQINNFDYLPMHARCMKVFRETYTSLATNHSRSSRTNPNFIRGEMINFLPRSWYSFSWLSAPLLRISLTRLRNRRNIVCGG